MTTMQAFVFVTVTMVLSTVALAWLLRPSYAEADSDERLDELERWPR